MIAVERRGCRKHDMMNEFIGRLVTEIIRSRLSILRRTGAASEGSIKCITEGTNVSVNWGSNARVSFVRSRPK